MYRYVLGATTFVSFWLLVIAFILTLNQQYARAIQVCAIGTLIVLLVLSAYYVLRRIGGVKQITQEQLLNELSYDQGVPPHIQRFMRRDVDQNSQRDGTDQQTQNQTGDGQ